MPVPVFHWPNFTAVKWNKCYWQCPQCTLKAQHKNYLQANAGAAKMWTWTLHWAVLKNLLSEVLQTAASIITDVKVKYELLLLHYIRLMILKNAKMPIPKKQAQTSTTYPQPKDIQFTITEENQKIFTFHNRTSTLHSFLPRIIRTICFICLFNNFRPSNTS